MKVVALLSGGKDSIYNAYKCVQYGHEIVAVAHLKPPEVGWERGTGAGKG